MNQISIGSTWKEAAVLWSCNGRLLYTEIRAWGDQAALNPQSSALNLSWFAAALMPLLFLTKFYLPHQSAFKRASDTVQFDVLTTLY